MKTSGGNADNRIKKDVNHVVVFLNTDYIIYENVPAAADF